MSKVSKQIQDLKQIIELLDNKKIHGPNEAVEKFKLHLDDVVTFGRFSIETWDKMWRISVYKFGTKFKDIDPIDFLKALTNKKQLLDKDKQEVLDFYYSEIESNSLPDETCSARIEALVSKYPYNPEFQHTFGHFCVKRNNYETAIEHYRFSLSKDKTNETFRKSLFIVYSVYLESFIDKSDYEKGQKICEDLITEKLFWEEHIYHNIFVSLKERFKDYIVLNKKILDAEVSIKEIISKETNKSQLKIIEILGFFTAIIAFVFSTVSIGKNFNFSEAIIFNVSLGITLGIFVLMISLLFSIKDVKLLDYRMILFAIMIISLVLIVFKYL